LGYTASRLRSELARRRRRRRRRANYIICPVIWLE
jgi:hypothetical protein